MVKKSKIDNLNIVKRTWFRIEVTQTGEGYISGAHARSLWYGADSQIPLFEETIFTLNTDSDMGADLVLDLIREIDKRNKENASLKATIKEFQDAQRKIMESK
jgi:hypothetical protein